jgi:hypothetical protein
LTEVYRNSTEYIYLDIYGDTADPGTVTATIWPANTAPPVDPETETSVTVNGPTTVGDAERWTATVGFAITQTVGEYFLTWKFQIDGVDIVRKDFLEIVVPLVDIATIRDELDIPADISDETIEKTERRVRVEVENFTSQQFAPRTATYQAVQKSDGTVRLPARIITLTGVGEGSSAGYYIMHSEHALGDWYLKTTIPTPLKRNGYRAWGGNGYSPAGFYDSGAPITSPYTSTWGSTTYIAVSGVWGWEYVPQDVQEAALILIEQRLCPEDLYRERYIKSMTAADMRFEFNPGAYVGTGNVVADQILMKYVRSAMAVI